MELSLFKFASAMYISGVGLAMWKIWFPCHRIITSLDRNNIMVKKPILSFLIVFVIFFIMFPFIAWIILFDDKIDRFQDGFVKGVLGINNDK